jgi:uncharacterized membrane protein YkoI
MEFRGVFSSWLGAGAGLALFTVAPARAEVVPLAQVPPAVQKGIQAQLGNGTLGEIDRDEENGEVTYNAEITKAGQARNYTLSESGALVSQEMFLQETPPAVQKAIQNLIGQGKIQNIDKTLDDEEVRYDVEWKTKEGAERSFSVLENGKLESYQIALEEAPAAIQAAIAKEAGTGQVKEVIKSFEDKAVYYDVTVNRDGKDRDFTVAESGKLESRQVFLPELPAAAQTSVQRTIGAGKLLRIDQIFDKKKGVFPFEVESLVDGKPYDFSIGPKGAFLGLD